MITRTEIAMLLTYAAGTDNRKVTPDAVQAWADALAPYVNIEDAKRAIAEHRATSDDYLMPVHINQAVKRYRADRISRAPYGDVPDGLDARQTNAWLTQYRAGIGDGHEPDTAQAAADHALRIERPKQLEADPDKIRRIVDKTRDALPKPPEVPDDAA